MKIRKEQLQKISYICNKKLCARNNKKILIAYNVCFFNITKKQRVLILDFFKEKNDINKMLVCSSVILRRQNK